MRATYEPIGGEAAKFITCVRSIVISQVKDKVKRGKWAFPLWAVRVDRAAAHL